MGGIVDIINIVWLYTIYKYKENENMNVQKCFTTKEAVRLSRLTKTMIDYLVRTELLSPSISGPCTKGQKRQFSFSDILILKVINKLLQQGVSVKKLKVALQSLTKSDRKEIERTGVWHYLVTDGNNIYLKRENEILVSLTQGGQLSFLFVIELQNLRSETIEEIQNLKVA